MAESTPEVGNYYAPEHYAGFFRRMGIIAIDLGVCIGVFVALAFIFDDPETHRLSPVVPRVFAAFAFAYFVVLESYVGTAGFLVTGSKIVTLKGERPGLLRMTFRLLIWILGPINVVVDLFWLTGDDYKQTLRDKFAGTLVVDRHAAPAGTGAIRLNRYQFLGQSFVFYEVTKPQ